MGISDMIGGKQTPESYSPLDKTTDFMNMRKLQSTDSLTKKLGQASHGVDHERGFLLINQRSHAPHTVIRRQCWRSL